MSEYVKEEKNHTDKVLYVNWKSQTRVLVMIWSKVVSVFCSLFSSYKI